MNFTTKVVSCHTYADVTEQAAALEDGWIWALLTRFNIDPEILEKARTDHSYPKYEWRDYLLLNFGIQIEKDYSSKKTVVKRTNLKNGSTIVVGEWSRPEIMIVKNKDERRYELHLKYFNLI